MIVVTLTLAILGFSQCAKLDHLSYLPPDSRPTNNESYDQGLAVPNSNSAAGGHVTSSSGAQGPGQTSFGSPNPNGGSVFGSQSGSFHGTGSPSAGVQAGGKVSGQNAAVGYQSGGSFGSGPQGQTINYQAPSGIHSTAGLQPGRTQGSNSAAGFHGSSSVNQLPSGSFQANNLPGVTSSHGLDGSTGKSQIAQGYSSGTEVASTFPGTSGTNSGYSQGSHIAKSGSTISNFGPSGSLQGQRAPAESYSSQSQYKYQSASKNEIPIIKLDTKNYGDGSYSTAYETGNGIQAEEQGQTQGDNSVVQGSFSYTSPEGEKIGLTYTADEDGYHPQGENLPTSPPIPKAILKSIEYNNAHPEQQNDDGSYKGEENPGSSGHPSYPQKQFPAQPNQYLGPKPNSGIGGQHSDSPSGYLSPKGVVSPNLHSSGIGSIQSQSGSGIGSRPATTASSSFGSGFGSQYSSQSSQAPASQYKPSFSSYQGTDQSKLPSQGQLGFRPSNEKDSSHGRFPSSSSGAGTQGNSAHQYSYQSSIGGSATPSPSENGASSSSINNIAPGSNVFHHQGAQGGGSFFASQAGQSNIGGQSHGIQSGPSSVIGGGTQNSPSSQHSFQPHNAGSLAGSQPGFGTDHQGISSGSGGNTGIQGVSAGQPNFQSQHSGSFVPSHGSQTIQQSISSGSGVKTGIQGVSAGQPNFPSQQSSSFVPSHGSQGIQQGISSGSGVNTGIQGVSAGQPNFQSQHSSSFVPSQGSQTIPQGISSGSGGNTGIQGVSDGQPNFHSQHSSSFVPSHGSQTIQQGKSGYQYNVPLPSSGSFESQQGRFPFGEFPNQVSGNAGGVTSGAEKVKSGFISKQTGPAITPGVQAQDENGGYIY